MVPGILKPPPTMAQPHPRTRLSMSSDVTAAALTGRSCVAAVAAERTWTHHATSSSSQRTFFLEDESNGQRSGRKQHFLKLLPTSNASGGAPPPPSPPPPRQVLVRKFRFHPAGRKSDVAGIKWRTWSKSKPHMLETFFSPLFFFPLILF